MNYPNSINVSKRISLFYGKGQTTWTHGTMLGATAGLAANDLRTVLLKNPVKTTTTSFTLRTSDIFNKTSAKESTTSLYPSITSMASTETTLPSTHLPISDFEAKFYYYGLFSKPVLVARTGNEIWTQPTGPGAFLRPKELRTIGKHDLKGIWEDKLGVQIYNILDSKGVMWTSMDVVRIGYVRESTAIPVVWIGIKPGTLSREDGHIVATECKKVLLANAIHDTEVEIRESVVTNYLGPPLEKPVDSYDPTAELQEPLTSTLGISVCSAQTPSRQGTGGFYVTDNKSQVYLITARHVVFQPQNNIIYNRKCISSPRINVLIQGPDAFNDYLEKIALAISETREVVEYQEQCISLQPESWQGHDHAQRILVEARNKINALQTLYNQRVQRWSNIKDRVLGFIRFSPPITYNVAKKGYTQDYAMIRVDEEKIDSTVFTGNAIDLGYEIPQKDFTRLMFSNPRNNHNFRYPHDRLLKIHGIISEKDMCHPTMLDTDGNPCLIVIKRGITTGLTIGRASEIASFLRHYFKDTPSQTSMEWAIFSYNKKYGPFSEVGDSGSAVVDCLGHLGGMITGGSGGSTDSTDITYATPAFSILESLKAHGFNVTIELPLTT